MTWDWSTVTAVLSALLIAYWVVVAIVVVTDDRDPTTTLAWLLVLLALPGVGLFFYVMSGDDPGLEPGEAAAQRCGAPHVEPALRHRDAFLGPRRLPPPPSPARSGRPRRPRQAKGVRGTVGQALIPPFSGQRKTVSRRPCALTVSTTPA